MSNIFMHAKQLLIIGLVWPEPTSSAAGTRMIQLVDLFLADGYQITFSSAAAKSDYSFVFSTKVKEEHIKLNDESFNTFVKALAPTVVMFDRFMIEEQYGWRVQQECPNALRILDTEDLHFLRRARTEANKKQLDFTPDQLYTTDAKREIAAILRCDLSLIISEIEMKILLEQFKIDAALLFYLPFLESKITDKTVAEWNLFNQRKDFMFIGNFLHEPNWKTVLTLKTEVWPQLSKLLPSAHLNIYGAYPTQKVFQLENKKERIFVKGRADDAKKTLSTHRVLLSPSKFGAGLKGKFIDAMQTGTPAITTSIGAEGMVGDLEWPGHIANDIEAFVKAAVALYTDEEKWTIAQQKGRKVINERYCADKFKTLFISYIDDLWHNLSKHRQANFIGQLLQHHTLQSSKYLSLWIEEKNKPKSGF
ncbi:glycosyltransferase involved in cell wall biosynthesis [Pedobacter sp. UYP30]|uniref:glycosyltransferase n=1 Tax=Pedobacter sp. UYP30 TaxID=1756400 RepID=UPI0033912EF2